MARIDRCKRVRKNLVKPWSDNVDYRRGTPFTEYDDEDRINVNIDWSMTKAKHAQLYSQTPQVYLSPKQKKYEQAVEVFSKQLKNTLDEANVGAAMDESILDAMMPLEWARASSATRHSRTEGGPRRRLRVTPYRSSLR